MAEQRELFEQNEHGVASEKAKIKRLEALAQRLPELNGSRHGGRR